MQDKERESRRASLFVFALVFTNEAPATSSIRTQVTTTISYDIEWDVKNATVDVIPAIIFKEYSLK